MNQVTDHLALPARAKPARLPHGLVHTNKEFPAERPSPMGRLNRFVIIESNHVSRSLVPQESLVEPGHLRRRHEINAQIKILCLQQVIKKRPGHPPQQPQIHRPPMLAVVQGKSSSWALGFYWD